MELAFGREVTAAWIGLVVAKEEGGSSSPLALDLYDGLPGVILFLAYLAKISREPHFMLPWPRAALKTLRSQIKGWGATGNIARGRIIYLLRP